MRNPIMNRFLEISFNKSSYFPDELITGYVQLSSSTQIIINEITLSIYLLENWIELTSVPTGDSNKKLLLSINLDIKKKLNIHTNLVSLIPGIFKFPFEFKLPVMVNPCFEFPAQEKKGYIRYSVDAQILSPYIQGATSTYIIFKSRPKMNNKDNKPLYTSSIDIYKWGMISEGNTTLSASLYNNETNIKYGEIINFNVDIDNKNGKLVANEIKVVLMRKIDFKKISSNEIKDSINNDCAVQKFKTLVNPGEKKNFNFFINLKDMDKNTFDLKNEKLPYTNINDISFFLPSLNSPIIDCTYTLRVTLYFDSFVQYKHRPRVYIPINICHQKVEEYMPYYLNNNNNYQNYNNYQNNNN